MEINNINNVTKSFGTQKLFTAKLKQILPNSSTQDVDTYISLLDNSDRDNILPLKSKFKDRLYCDLIADMYSSTVGNKNIADAKLSENSNKFIIVEFANVPQNTPFAEKILSMSGATLYKDKLYINYLESLKSNDINGAASCILYALTKIAILNNKFGISVLSSNSALEFYKKYYFERVKNNCDNFLCLQSENFDNFQKLIEAKYKIKST